MTRTLPDALAHFAFGPSPQMEPITGLLSMIHEIGREQDTTGYRKRYGQEAYEKHRLAEITQVTQRTAQRWWNVATGNVTEAQRAQGNAPRPNKVAMTLIRNQAEEDQKERLSEPRTEAFIKRIEFLERVGASVSISATFVFADLEGNETDSRHRVIGQEEPVYIEPDLPDGNSPDWQACLDAWREGRTKESAQYFTFALFRAMDGWSETVSIEDVDWIDLRGGYHATAQRGGRKTA